MDLLIVSSIHTSQTSFAAVLFLLRFCGIQRCFFSILFSLSLEFTTLRKEFTACVSQLWPRSILNIYEICKEFNILLGTKTWHWITQYAFFIWLKQKKKTISTMFLSSTWDSWHRNPKICRKVSTQKFDGENPIPWIVCANHNQFSRNIAAPFAESKSNGQDSSSIRPM